MSLKTISLGVWYRTGSVGRSGTWVRGAPLHDRASGKVRHMVRGAPLHDRVNRKVRNMGQGCSAA